VTVEHGSESYLDAFGDHLGRLPNPPRRLLKLCSILGFLGLWWVFVDVGFLGFGLLPTPLETLQALFEYLAGQPVTRGGATLYLHSYYTLYRVTLGIGLAIVLAIPLGLLIGWSDLARRYVYPAFELLRPIPPVAWVPIALVAFSSTLVSIVWVVFIGAFFPLLLNTIDGVQSIEPGYVRAVESLGGSDWDLFRHVIVPASIPSIVTGTMVSIGIGWIAVVAAEMLSGEAMESRAATAERVAPAPGAHLVW